MDIHNDLRLLLIVPALFFINSYCGPESAVLFANHPESKSAISDVHHRHRTAYGDAVLCFRRRAFGSYRPQVDHDARMFAGCRILPPDLSRDATSGGLGGDNRSLANEPSNRRH